MTDHQALTEASYNNLVRSLDTLADGGQELSDAGPLFHRLRNLVIVLQSTGPVAIESHDSALSLPEALTLTSTSQGLLSVMREMDYGGRVSAEMDQALSETLSNLEAQLGATWRSSLADKIRGLYVIIDPTVTGGREPLEIATAAVRGGAKMLQLRDKLRDKGVSLPLATALQELCVANDALLIINDHVDLAAAVGSGGVHVGQTDLPVAQARQVLAPFQVLGRSNHEIEELIESQKMGADHVAFGAIYPTTTKGVGRGPQGPERLKEARAAAKVPLVAIGGINAENVAPVVEAGADAICVTAAVGSAPDPEAAAHRLVEAIRQAGGKV
ncbi:MAG: thiamine phosphate synthase [Dehalococcoidia bacterium]